jgi:ABC-type transport system involved in multi-copper enzyme maturation permease subunit
VYNSGNLAVALSDLRALVDANTPIAKALPGLLQGYTFFHLGLTGVCAILAVLRLRPIALQQISSVRPRVATRRSWHFRPGVGRLPMIWKEIFIEPGFRLNWLGKLGAALLVILSFLPALWILLEPSWTGKGSTSPQSGPIRVPGVPFGPPIVSVSVVEEMNGWVRLVGNAVACLLLVAVSVRASTCVSGERDRDTLDGLLTSPLHSHDILFAKWLGSLLSVRWGWLWLGGIWLLALCYEAIHPLGMLLIAIAWLIYASCLAGIGLWFSTACRTTLRATVSTLAVTACVGFGQMILWMCCSPITTSVSGMTQKVDPLSLLTPPSVFYFLSASYDEFGTGLEWDLLGIGILVGLFLWAMSALFLWTITRTRFRMLTARMPHRRPDQGRPRLLSEWGYLPVKPEWMDEEDM